MSQRLLHALRELRSWVGLSSRVGAARYAEVLFPRDRPAWAKEAAASMSSCGLLVGAYLRALGIKHARLDRPYEGRSDAMATIVFVGRDLGCWVVPSQSSEPPNVGDCVLMGRNGDPTWGTPTFEHFFVLAEYDAEDGHFVCIEGGQGPRGASVGESRRIFLWRGDALWAVKASAPLTARGEPAGRRVVGFFSAAQYFANHPSERPPPLPPDNALARPRRPSLPSPGLSSSRKGRERARRGPP